ncbi:MAG: UPF0147 family protein [Candidatus Syntropharchaeia archaeon]
MSDPNEVIGQCIEMLDRIINDNSVPRNIRRVADTAKKELMSDESPPSQRAVSTIPMLDEITNDPNIPIHTRTLLWSIVSLLEGIPIE